MYLRALNTGVGVRPETSAVGPNRRVPARELRQGDAVLASNYLATLTDSHEVEAAAVGSHAVLDRARGLDAVGRGGGRGRRGETDDTDTDVDVGPETRAGSAADLRVPGGELGYGDAVAAGNRGAGVSTLDHVETVAVGDHSRLSGLGSLDAIAGGRGRRRRRGESDRADANIDVEPQASACSAANLSVPRRELSHRDTVAAGDGCAGVATLDEMEAVAVVHHTGLDGLRRLDTIARSSGGGRGSEANDTDADICVQPETGTVAANFRVPGVEISKSDAVQVGDDSTGLTGRHEVELVAVANHARLSRLRGLDAITRGSCGGGRRGGSRSRGGRRGRSRARVTAGMVESLHAVRLVGDEVVTRLGDNGVLFDIGQQL